MFKTYSSLSSLVITSLLVHDKPLEAPASVKRVYCIALDGISTTIAISIWNIVDNANSFIMFFFLIST